MSRTCVIFSSRASHTLHIKARTPLRAEMSLADSQNNTLRATHPLLLCMTPSDETSACDVCPQFSTYSHIFLTFPPPNLQLGPPTNSGR